MGIEIQGNDECAGAWATIDEFQDLWDRGGAEPDVEVFLAGRGGVPAKVLLTLLQEDMHRRWEVDHPRDVADYFAKHPDLVDDPELAVDLIYEEFRIRMDRGDAPDADDYFRRFPKFRDRLERQLLITGLLASLDEETPLTVAPRTAFVLHSTWDRATDGDAHEPGDSSDFLSISDFDLGEPFPPGGMGIVYRARQKSLDRLVVLKFLYGSERHATEGPKRLLEEARVLARLAHEHIVRIWGFGRCPQRGFFLVMDLIEGPSLAQRLAAGPLDVRQAVAYAIDVAEAIHHAHRRQILHLDLKPGNVLLDLHAEGGCRIKVVDFGLARRIGFSATELRGANLWAGTLAYLAPEQAMAGWGALGPRTDVYGLGALLFAMLTGRPPCDGRTPNKLRTQVVSATPVPRVRTCRRDVPRGLEAIVARCLEKDPVRRYESADEVARALRAWLRQRPRRLLLGGVVFAGLALLPILWFAVWPDPAPKSPPVDVAALEIRCGDRRDNLLERPEDLLPGDQLSFRVVLSRPGYPYLFLVDTDGSVNRLYPAPGARLPSHPVSQFFGPPEQQAIRIDGREGTVAVVLLVGEARLQVSELGRIESVLKAHAPLRERLAEYPILVDGLTPEDWASLHRSTERARGTPVFRVEPAINAALDRLRAELPVGDRAVRILTLRQRQG